MQLQCLHGRSKYHSCIFEAWFALLLSQFNKKKKESLLDNYAPGITNRRDFRKFSQIKLLLLYKTKVLKIKKKKKNPYRSFHVISPTIKRKEKKNTWLYFTTCKPTTHITYALKKEVKEETVIQRPKWSYNYSGNRSIFCFYLKGGLGS